MNLNFSPHIFGKAVNLSSSNQDLRQGYFTAKHVFEHVKPGTIKFVLIGLAPYSFRYENTEAFSVCPRNLQYMLALNDSTQATLHDLLLKILVSDNVKKIFLSATTQQADLNFDGKKNIINAPLSAKAVIDWEIELKNLTKKFRPKVIEKNFRILQDYIKLCLDNGAKPVGVIFPFAPVIRKNYDRELLNNFREKIRQLEKNYEFTCVDLFDLNLGYDCFYNTAHLNLHGSIISSSILTAELNEKNILPTEIFCQTSYEYLNCLAKNLPKENYIALMSRVFEKSAALIRRKNKIKIGFVIRVAAEWCGDDLYNFFEQDERFEPTVFLCLRTDESSDKLVREDFAHGTRQFKSRGLNVFPVAQENSPVPAQDILIFLTPYLFNLPKAFHLTNLSAKTLTAYIPYAFWQATYNIFWHDIFNVLWKIFFESRQILKIFNETRKEDTPRVIYSGYPKLDVFYGKQNFFRFDWKKARPDAKKIIYAPHWSINDGVMYATFQWNYKFMYEFAKAHPEISWVFKPHPALLFSAVESGLFPSTEAFEKYLQAWDALPNAKVVTGAYYQALFATSDGMILDSGSFIAEYQYTHKPMIFLRRDTQDFNEVGIGILNVSYLVDGRDLSGIASLMHKVFIEGNDPKFYERQKFFNEHLDYFKQNGMSASEFIYKNILQGIFGRNF